MSWKCPNCEKEIFTDGDTCPSCGVRTPRDSWAFKCAWLGRVIASNEYGAFALDKAKRKLWVALPDAGAFEINTSAFRGDHAAAIAILHKIWDAKCGGACPITAGSFQEIWNTVG